jgi:hypothetical protein
MGCVLSGPNFASVATANRRSICSYSEVTDVHHSRPGPSRSDPRPEAIDPGAVMNAQADVSIFDIPARAGATRSFARRLVDAIMESRRRAAEEFLTEYNRAHKDDLAAHQGE